MRTFFVQMKNSNLPVKKNLKMWRKHSSNCVYARKTQFFSRANSNFSRTHKMCNRNTYGKWLALIDRFPQPKSADSQNVRNFGHFSKFIEH